MNNEHIALVRTYRKELSRVSIYKALLPAIFDWSVIACCIYVSQASPSYLLYFFSIIIIATRQHALLVITHDAAHYHLSKIKWFNDFISNLFLAYPNFFCTNGYRENHRLHHRFLNSDKDPDWARKIHLKEWQFPQKGSALLKTFVKILFTSWYKLALLFLSLSLNKHTWKSPQKIFLFFSKVCFYFFFLCGIIKLHWWQGFLIYWIVPFFLIFPLLERIRSISEHFGLARTSEFNMARNILCPWWEAFLFAPHNIRYHLDHHLFPGIPLCHLPKLHSLLMQDPLYANTSHQNDSYFWGSHSVMKDILQTK